MNLTIAIILVVLLLMVLVLFFILKREVNDINNKSKVYFTRKAQEYTDSISRDKEEEPVDTVEDVIEDKKEDNENISSSVIYVEKKANYEINDLLKMMKQIDEGFSVNNVTTIKKFISTYVKEDKDKLSRYKDLKEMKKYIDKIGVYNIIVNDDINSIDNIVNDLRLINEDIFMEYYAGKDIFEVEDFCNFLDYEIGNCDPTIYVYVGNDKLDYNKIDKRIKTVYSKDIYKGIKIVYLNKLYDYSLS